LRREWRTTFLFLSASFLGAVVACGWDPHRPFDRNAPAVDQAISAYDAGDARAASEILEGYLSTGACNEGNMGTPDLLKKRPNGTIDLGLSLFSVAESFGRRFGEEEIDAGWGPEDRGQRGSRVACALHVVRAIAEDPAQSIEARARARYLEGNLDFLNGEYKDAVAAYDRSLALAPGREPPPDGSTRVDDAMDALGRDAAYNRAIALRRQRDKEKDAGDDGGGDGGGDSGGGDGGDGGGDSGNGDGGGNSNDGGGDAGNNADAAPPPPPPDGGGPPPKADQDERILDQLERAPTMQQETAKRQGGSRIRGMIDK
jgi:hypothetical protein